MHDQKNEVDHEALHGATDCDVTLSDAFIHGGPLELWVLSVGPLLFTLQ